MFKLRSEEYVFLKSQIVTSKVGRGENRSNSLFLQKMVLPCYLES